MKNRKTKIRTLIDPITSPKQVRREVQAATRLEFRPLARQIRGEKRASKQHSRNIRGWYKDQDRQLKGIRKQGVNVQNRILQNLQQSSNAAAERDSSRTQMLADEEARSAALRGVTYDPSSTTRDTVASAIRRSIDASNAGRIGAQTQANANALGQIRAAAKIGRNAALQAERNTRQNINDDLRELQEKRGDFAVDYKAELRQGERDYALQRATLAGKGDYNDAIRDVAELGLQGKLASAGATKVQAKLGLKGDKIKAGAYGNNSQGDKISAQDIQRASSFIRAELTKSGKGWKYVEQNRNQVIDYLVNRGVDPRTARIAANRYIRRRRKATTGRPGRLDSLPKGR